MCAGRKTRSSVCDGGGGALRLKDGIIGNPLIEGILVARLEVGCPIVLL